MGCKFSKINEGYVRNSKSGCVMDDLTKDFVRASLRKCVYFRGFQTVDLDEIIACLTKRTYYKNEFIYKMNQEADAIYIILKGQTALTQNDRIISNRMKGDVIMDSGMIYGQLRTCSFQALENDCIILKLYKQDYERVAVAFYRRKISSTYDVIYRSNLFQEVPISYLKRIETICHVQTFNKGEVITRQGETTSKIYIVRSGEAHEYDHNGDASIRNMSKPISSLGSSSSFGEECMACGSYLTTVVAGGANRDETSLPGVVIASKIAAEDQTVILAIDIFELNELLQDVMEKVVSFGNQKYQMIIHMKQQREIYRNKNLSTNPYPESAQNSNHNESFGFEESKHSWSINILNADEYTFQGEDVQNILQMKSYPTSRSIQVSHTDVAKNASKSTTLDRGHNNNRRDNYVSDDIVINPQHSHVEIRSSDATESSMITERDGEMYYNNGKVPSKTLRESLANRHSTQGVQTKTEDSNKENSKHQDISFMRKKTNPDKDNLLISAKRTLSFGSSRNITTVDSHRY